MIGNTRLILLGMFTHVRWIWSCHKRLKNVKLNFEWVCGQVLRRFTNAIKYFKLGYHTYWLLDLIDLKPKEFCRIDIVGLQHNTGNWILVYSSIRETFTDLARNIWLNYEGRRPEFSQNGGYAAGFAEWLRAIACHITADFVMLACCRLNF